MADTELEELYQQADALMDRLSVAVLELTTRKDRLNQKFPGVTFKGPFVNVWGNPQIGDGTQVAAFVEIGDGVVIGRNCRIGAYVFLCPGVTLGDGVFVGPRCTFTNDRHPPSKREDWRETFVQDRAVLGAGAIILPGLTIGEGARIGAGAVVTKSVPPGQTWCGVPARKL